MPTRKLYIPDRLSAYESWRCFGAWFAFQMTHVKENKVAIFGKWAGRTAVSAIIGYLMWLQATQTPLKEIPIPTSSNGGSIMPQAFAGEDWPPPRDTTYTAYKVRDKDVLYAKDRFTGTEKMWVIPFSELRLQKK